MNPRGTIHRHAGWRYEDNRSEVRTRTEQKPTKSEGTTQAWVQTERDEGMSCRWRDTGNGTVLMIMMIIRWVWHCKWWFHISKTNLSSWVHLSSLFGSLVLWFSSITSSLGSSRHRQLPSGAETKTRTKSMLENTHPTWAAVHQIHLKGKDVSK